MDFNGRSIANVIYDGIPVSQIKFNGVNVLKGLIYGVSWDKSSNPVLTRTNASVGMVANAGVDSNVVVNDFDNAEIYKDITEVIDSYGNVFVRIPKFYIRKTDGVGSKTIQISRFPLDGAYLPWCFWNFSTNTELPHIDIGKYKASLSADNKLESKINKYPLINKTIINFRDYARANNTGGLLGYQQLDIHARDIIECLFQVEFATLNSQSIMQGFTTGQLTAAHTAVIAESGVNRIVVTNAVAALYVVGQTISVSSVAWNLSVFYGRQITAINVYDASNKYIVFDGTAVNIAIGNILHNTGQKNGITDAVVARSGSPVSNADGKRACKYRGIESPWGDCWQWVDGFNINEYQSWVCKDANSYASNLFANPYESLGYVNKDADGYASERGFDASKPFAEMTTNTLGGSATYYSDYYYRNSGQRAALVGGRWNSGANAGLFYWNLYYSSDTADFSVAGRLVRKAL